MKIRVGGWIMAGLGWCLAENLIVYTQMHTVNLPCLQVKSLTSVIALTCSTSIIDFFHTSVCSPSHPAPSDAFKRKWFHRFWEHFVAWLHFLTHRIIYGSWDGSDLAVVLFMKTSQGDKQRNIQLIRSVTDAWAAKSWWRWVRQLWSAKPRA